MRFVKLESIADINIGLALNRKKSPTKTPHHYKHLSLKAFDDDYIKLEFLEDFYATDKLDSTYIAEPNDIVIRLRQPLKAIVLDKSYLISSNMAKLRLKSSEFDPIFLAEYINQAKSQLEKHAVGSAISLLSIKEIKEFLVPKIDLEKQALLSNVTKVLNERKKTLNELIAKEETLKNMIFKQINNKLSKIKDIK